MGNMKYKYIFDRWVRIVFELKIHLLFPTHVPRIDGYQHTWVLHTKYSIRTYERLSRSYTTPIYILYYAVILTDLHIEYTHAITMV